MPVVQTEFTLDGETVTLAIDVEPALEPPATRGLESASFGGDDEGRPGRTVTKVAEMAKDLFGIGMKTAFACGRRAAQAYLAIPGDERPVGVELELAFNLDTQFGAVLAKAGAEAQVRVTMRWGSAS